jgi:nucleoside phosphorylase/tetratricopeptide (TPR) repeat protein
MLKRYVDGEEMRRASNLEVQPFEAAACLPAGVYGTTSATAIVSHIKSTFPNIQYGLMAGIAGGVPSDTADIRLGDVVVSKPTGTLGGVVQYDLGKTVGDGHFQRTGMLNQPLTILLTAASEMEAYSMMNPDDRISRMMAEIFSRFPTMKGDFSGPLKEDDLFESTSPMEKKSRAPRVSSEPRVHYGIVASGNRVIKHGPERDAIGQESNALCFEMEAAGIMNHLPCLVVRGICDYCDAHKNKEWQGYAALVAAIYTKILLSFVPTTQNLNKQVPKTGTWMVPFDRNPRFLGRADLINQLETQIASKNRARKAAISGLGGMGKTQIALELAHRMRDQYPERSIFWIPSTSIEAVEQALLNLGQLLELPGLIAADAKSQVQTYLSSERAGSWLLIIDNADDPDMWVTLADSPPLKDFLPRNRNGFVLFTTRNKKLATQLVGPDVITLSEMNDQTATGLLRESLLQKDIVDDNEAITTLVHQLCCLPLALVQAASFMNENSVSPEEYLSLLDTQKESLIDLLSENFEDEFRYRDTENPIAATWLVSFQQIQKSDPLAADYLSYIACIDPRDIPITLIPPSHSVLETQKSLGTLKAYSFITAHTNNRFLSMHRLVHLATRNWLARENLLPARTKLATDLFNSVFPSTDLINRRPWRECLPHAQYLLGCQELDVGDKDKDLLAFRVSYCLIHDGRYNEAGMICQQIFEARRQQLDSHDEGLLLSMGYMSSIYKEQERWDKAEELLVQIVDSQRTFLGDEHPETLTSKGNLAMAYWNMGRLVEAVDLEVQVFEARERTLGDEHPQTLTSKNNLARILVDQGNLGQAEELQVQVSEAIQWFLGEEHPNTLQCQSSLAALYGHQRRLIEAEELQVQVLEASKRVLGDDHPDTLIREANLAVIAWNRGRLDEAEELLVHASQTSETVLGAEHNDTVTRKRWLMQVREGLKSQVRESRISDDGSETQAEHLGNQLEHPKQLPRRSKRLKLSQGN